MNDKTEPLYRIEKRFPYLAIPPLYDKYCHAVFIKQHRVPKMPEFIAFLEKHAMSIWIHKPEFRRAGVDPKKLAYQKYHPRPLNKVIHNLMDPDFI